MKYRVPANVKLASSLLLRLIVKYYGGLSDVASMNKLSRQMIHHFVTYGYVPLTKVYSVSKNLKVPIWALSYVKLQEVFGEMTPSMENVLKDLKILSSEEKEAVLKVYNRK